MSEMDAVLHELRQAGVEAEAAEWVGDENPLQAIDDVLRLNEVDENFREHDLAKNARERFGIPIHEVVVR